METLKDHTAIISGGAGDIGGSIALELASRGANIAIGDLKKASEVRPLLSRIRQNQVGISYKRLDVSRESQVNRWVTSVKYELGTPDIAIACAGQATVDNILTITANKWQREFQVNLEGALWLARSVAKGLLEEGQPGHIVFIGSWAGHYPQVHNPAYAPSKTGLTALTKIMALELSPHGILVNEIAPGNVNAGLSRKYYEDHPNDLKTDLRVVPIKSLTQPEELAWHIANLCDPRNKSITGTSIFIDGGLSALPNLREK